MLSTRGVLAVLTRNALAWMKLDQKVSLDSSLLVLACRLEPLRGWCKQVVLPTRGVLANLGRKCPCLDQKVSVDFGLVVSLGL